MTAGEDRIAEIRITVADAGASAAAYVPPPPAPTSAVAVLPGLIVRVALSEMTPGVFTAAAAQPGLGASAAVSERAQGAAAGAQAALGGAAVATERDQAVTAAALPSLGAAAAGLERIPGAAAAAQSALTGAGTASSLVMIAGTASNLSSDCASESGIFGLCCQVSFWSTSDGHRHGVYNRGSLNGAGNSLQLVTSTDGVTWTNVLTFAATDASSNASFVKVSSTVWWGAYGDNAGAVRVVRLVYASSTWTIGTGPETIPLSAGVTGRNPSIMVDGATTPTLWVSMLCHDSTNGDYCQVFHRTGSPGYTNTGIKFASPDISSVPRRSMALVQVPGGLFAVYTHHGTLNYRRHNLVDTIGTWTNEAALYNDGTDTSPYHDSFSVAADSARNLYVAYSGGGGRLLSFVWNAAGTSWSNQFVTVSIGSGMPQSAVSDTDVVWAITQDQYTNGLAYKSADGGSTFALAGTYGHALGTSTVSYPNPYPRALPPTGSATPSILLEYTDATAGREKALAY